MFLSLAWPQQRLAGPCVCPQQMRKAGPAGSRILPQILFQLCGKHMPVHAVCDRTLRELVPCIAGLRNLHLAPTAGDPACLQ